MDSKNGGLSSGSKQRQAAAELARQKVLDAYEEQEVKKAADYITKREGLGASATPVLRTVSNEDWKKYHTAWQDYYQKYYSEYYMNAAKEYVAKQQVKEIRAQARDEEVERQYDKTATMIASREEAKGEQASAGLKSRIRAKALEKEKRRTSRRRKLIPVIAGLTVVL